MDVNVRAAVEFLRRLKIDVNAEKDSIFEDDIDGWIELEKNS
jgi:hypothetical protein